MKHKAHGKRKSLRRRLKRMAAAAAVAGVALVSSAFLPGISATAHASAAPHAAPRSDTAGHSVKVPKGKFNVQTESKTPLKKLARKQAKAAEHSQQAHPHGQQAMTENAAVSKKVAKQVQATPAATKPATNIPETYQDVLHVKATAYAPGPHDNGRWGNKTHMGTTVRPGIIAVDPNVIPLGSRVYIEYPDGTGHYAVAEDTGGAIKGNRIDIAMDSVDKAYDFGIKNVKVYVIG